MSGFRVGVTHETFLPYGLEPLDRAGVDWELLPDAGAPLPPALISGYDALFHFAVGVTRESLEQADRLALIARHGVGLDMIDLDACTDRGVAVTITPDAIPHPIASAAVAFVLALAHRLVERNAAFHEGRWHDGRFSLIGTGLAGRTLGIVGYGRIGREVARLLEPYGMRLLVATRTPPDDPSVTHVELDALLTEADIVVLACPLTPETHHLLDARRLALLKPTALLVNVARGAVVDQDALVAALREGRLAAAGLDVFENEPVPTGDQLVGLPNLVAAPHALGYTDELFRGCVESACRAILDVRRGRAPEHVANRAVLERPAFLEKLERLAKAESEEPGR